MYRKHYIKLILLFIFANFINIEIPLLAIPTQKPVPLTIEWAQKETFFKWQCIKHPTYKFLYNQCFEIRQNLIRKMGSHIIHTAAPKRDVLVYLTNIGTPAALELIEDLGIGKNKTPRISSFF